MSVFCHCEAAKRPKQPIPFLDCHATLVMTQVLWEIVEWLLGKGLTKSKGDDIK